MAKTKSRFGLVNKGAVAKGSMRELPVAASQLVKPDSGMFVYLDSSGHVTLLLTATAYVYGWAFFPTSLIVGGTDDSNGYYTSNAVAGTDKVIVCNSLDAIYRVPCTATLAVDARVGECADVAATNNGAGQTVTPGTNSQDVLLVVGIPEDGDTSSILVKLNPNEMQRDT